MPKPAIFERLSSSRTPPAESAMERINQSSVLSSTVNRIIEEERDTLRFFWKCKGNSEIETLRFTRALFGLTSSPFLLGGVIQQHLKAWEERDPVLVAQIRKSLYVDDLITGAPTVQQTQEQKKRPLRSSATLSSPSTNGSPTPLS